MSPTKKYDVFISHKTVEDGDIALRLVANLEAHGLHCWIAPRDIPAARNYASAIVDGINQSSVFLLLFSRYANQSKDIEREVQQAARFQTPILTVRLDDTEFSPSLSYFLALPQGVGPFGRNERLFAGVFEHVRALLDGSENTPSKVVVPGRRFRFGSIMLVAMGAVAVLSLLAGKLPEYRNSVTKKAIAAFHEEDWGRGYKYASSLFADKNNPEILHHIGVLHTMGTILPLDDKKAVQYFLKAADMGDRCAQAALGAMYELGRGVPSPDPELAFYWYRKAAVQGHPEGQRNLARCYETGKGTSLDLAKAMDWYNRSAKQGNPRAIEALERLSGAPSEALPESYPSTRAEVQQLNEVIAVVARHAEAYQEAAHARAILVAKAHRALQLGKVSILDAEIPAFRRTLASAIGKLSAARPAPATLEALHATPIPTDVLDSLFDVCEQELCDDIHVLPMTLSFYVGKENPMSEEDRLDCLERQSRLIHLKACWYALGVFELFSGVSPSALTDFKKLLPSFTAIPRLSQPWPQDKEQLEIEMLTVEANIQEALQETSALSGKLNMETAAERADLEKLLVQSGISPNRASELAGKVSVLASQQTNLEATENLLAAKKDSLYAKFKPLPSDEPGILWSKALRFRSVNMPDAALEALGFLAAQNSRDFLPGAVRAMQALCSPGNTAPIGSGVMVSSYEPPATSHAVFRPGDIVVARDGTPVRRVSDWETAPGSTYRFWRLGDSGTFQSHEAVLPPDQPRVGLVEITEHND